MIKNPAIALAAFLLTLLGGCAGTPARMTVPAPLSVPRAADAPDQVRLDQQSSAAPTRLVQNETPHVDQPDSISVVVDAGNKLPPMGDQPVSINVTDLPIAVLANEVYGNILGLNVTIDPKVSSMQELVTLNTQERMRPAELFVMTRQVLADYGVSVDFEGKTVRITPAPQGGSAEPPLVVSGRALPSVPVSHRPVFQLLELEVVSAGDAARWLQTLFGDAVKVTEEPTRNAILLSGRPNDVHQAVESLRVFDRPLMRGRVSTRLEPAFLGADELATRLTEVLSLQGYSANRSVGAPASVIVLPVATANSVIIFATTQQTLDYAVSWARELDRPSRQAGAQSMFYYQVKNTKASDIADILSSSLRNSARADAGTAATSAPPAAAQPAAQPASRGRVSTGYGDILVDAPRNALIYQGDPSQWERMLALIRQMDREPRQVMVEVTIAEVSLNDDKDFGVNWFAKNGFGRFSGNIFVGQGSGGTGSSSGAPGLTYLVDVAGQNRAMLTAFANDNRVSILSTPRLLVKSGSEANIDVGTEVPTVTMSTTSNQTTDGNTNLLQSIQYRKTGILLRVKPTVYSDDRIDLDISQEVSEALPLDSGATANSPSIFNRSLETSLSLRDGGSVVMAGLISNRKSDVDSGVPFVKDIPLFGNLFKTKSIKKSRTELVLIIVPYIVESDERATSLSQAVIDRFELLDLDHAIGTGSGTARRTPQAPPARLPPPAAQPQPQTQSTP